MVRVGIIARVLRLCRIRNNPQLHLQQKTPIMRKITILLLVLFSFPNFAQSKLNTPAGELVLQRLSTATKPVPPSQTSTQEW